MCAGSFSSLPESCDPPWLPGQQQHLGVHPEPIVFSLVPSFQEARLQDTLLLCLTRLRSCLSFPCSSRVKAPIWLPDQSFQLPCVISETVSLHQSIQIYTSITRAAVYTSCGPIIHHLSAYVSFMLPAIYYPALLLPPLLCGVFCHQGLTLSDLLPPNAREQKDMEGTERPHWGVVKRARGGGRLGV